MSKRFLICLLFLCVAVGCVSISALAEEESEQESVYVFVTLADGEGKTVLAHEEITVEDTDGDGVLTIHDALTCAHAQKYTGEGEGYRAERTEYGLSMTKLWGCENGGSYGYYLNNQSPQSLADPIEKGDSVHAFVYTDLTAWSDTYCYFDKEHVAVSGDGALTLTLYAMGYDADWNPVSLPVAGASITIDGKATPYVTDEEGKVTLTFDGAGYCVVSAVKEGVNLVPPVCAVAVSSGSADAGDRGGLLPWIGLGFAALVAILPLGKRFKHETL